MKQYFNSILDGSLKNKHGNIIRLDQIMIYFKYNNKEMFEKIKSSGKKYTQFIYDVLNDISESPKCECGNDLRFINFERDYGMYCSKKCQINGLHKHQRENGWFFKREECLDNMRKNNIVKYGVEYPFQSKEYQEMMTKKTIEKYGVKRTSQLQEIAGKISIGISKCYNEKLLNSDYRGFVYILEFEDNIKIGRTLKLKRRLNFLKREFGEFKILKIIRTKTMKYIENELHKICNKHRVCLNEGNGRTEFFTKEIKDIKEIQKWLK